jgi:hypothetical protein
MFLAFISILTACMFFHRLTMFPVQSAEFLNPPTVSVCQHMCIIWHLTRSSKHGYVNLKTLELLLI